MFTSTSSRSMITPTRLLEVIVCELRQNFHQTHTIHGSIELIQRIFQLIYDEFLNIQSNIQV